MKLTRLSIALLIIIAASCGKDVEPSTPPAPSTEPTQYDIVVTKLYLYPKHYPGTDTANNYIQTFRFINTKYNGSIYSEVVKGEYHVNDTGNITIGYMTFADTLATLNSMQYHNLNTAIYFADYSAYSNYYHPATIFMTYGNGNITRFKVSKNLSVNFVYGSNNKDTIPLTQITNACNYLLQKTLYPYSKKFIGWSNPY